MIDVVTKIFCSFLCGLCITYTCIKTNDLKYSKLNILISALFISIITYITYKVNYNSELLLLKLIVSIIVIKTLFKLSTYKAVISMFITMILMSISEILSGLILVKFLTIAEARSTWYFILFCNILICLITVAIINIPILQRILNKFINKTENKRKVTTILLFTLSVVVLVYLFYNISINYRWNEKYIITILIMISYIVISFIFFKDKLEYNMLEEKYDAIFEYFSEIAESIDDLNLTTHEYKNQIAIVSNYIDDRKYKKAKNYIKDIAKSINKDEGLLVNLTDIPTGGLKGLLYYKIIVARNQKIEIVLDVGKDTKRIFNRLSENQIKVITRIIGVYIDNALGATKNRIINIEIYNLNDQLYFTISNKVDKNIQIDNIGKKGYTTKGNGHGQGLYLTNKLINKNKWLKNSNKLVNNYYVSKLIVDTKNIGK